MEILCRLRFVDLIENKRIGIVLSQGQVKRLHAWFSPHERQVLAGGLDKLPMTLRLNLRFNQHDYFLVRHLRLLLSILTGGDSDGRSGFTRPTSGDQRPSMSESPLIPLSCSSAADHSNRQ